MILIMTGKFYCTGFPRVITENMKIASKWLKENNYTECKDGTGLFEKHVNGQSYWARCDRVEFYDGEKLDLLSIRRK